MILFLIVCGFLFYFNQLYIVLIMLQPFLLIASIFIFSFTVPDKYEEGESGFHFYDDLSYDQFYNLFLLNIDILFVNLVIVILTSYFNKLHFDGSVIFFGFISFMGLITFCMHKFEIKKLYKQFKNINLKEID